MPEEKRPLKVFLCHARADKQKVRELYRYLRKRGIQPWLDAEDLVGGQDWREEIPKAIRSSEAIIICLSKNSIDKEGYVQAEITFALERALEIPTGRIFIIPARFEDCEVPHSLERYHWVDLFEQDGFPRLMKSLKTRAAQLERATVKVPKSDESSPNLATSAEKKVEGEVAKMASHEKAEQGVVKRIAQINLEPTDALHDGKPYISIDITSEENRLIKCYSYIKSLELNGVVRDDIKNQLINHTNRVSWSGGSDEEVGIKNIDPKGFGKINLVSLNFEDFIRNFLQFETAKGPQFKDKAGNLLPFGAYIIDLGLSCASAGEDFVDIPIKIGFEYIEEHDYFEDNKIISGRETRKVLRLLKIEPSESVSGSKIPNKIFISEKDIKRSQEKRMFYDLTMHYECDFENTKAEILANFLLESLTRIMRTVTGVDKDANNRTVEYQTSQVEYLDSKDGKTTKHALIVHGKKVLVISKGDLQGVEPLTAVPEMLIITVTQAVNGSRLRFDSNELPNGAFKDLVEWILLDLGQDVSVQVKDATSDEETLPKQDQHEINVGKRETTSSEIPKDGKSESRKTITRRKPNTAIIVALIGFAGTIIAGLLSSPMIEKWFFPTRISTEMVTATLALTFQSTVPSKTIEPNQEPTKSITPSPISTERFTPTVTLLPTEITDAKGVQMVLVPAAEFTMGSSNGAPDERPFHTVYIDTFYMDKYEVTNSFYRVCVDIGACQPPVDSPYYDNSNFSDHPVSYINWYMAKAYCAWRDARLPTEAEWEKSARGTDGTTYPWGETIDCSYANYRGQNDYCVGKSSPVGSYESGKSPYGIFDLAGNVTEWVSSLNKSYPYDANDGRENLNSVGDRILRGGSWNNKDILLRSTDRGWNAPLETAFDYGFRCAKDANP